MTLPNWQYLNAKPTQHGKLRVSNNDFKVFENLGYEADGSDGEHLFIEIEKNGLNTAYVAKLIARWANVTVREVSYAGKKDRHAITRQHFSVQIPGKESPDLALLESEQLTVLSAKRHSKKLRTGALKGNRFELFIHGLTLDSDLTERLERIKISGVPNYFGEQRFGFDGENIDRARALFNGEKVKNRDLRSIYLSSARSLLFNNVVSERLLQKLDNKIISGDAFILNGSKAAFTPPIIDDVIKARFAAKDIILSAPLWGNTKNAMVDDALAFESSIIEQDADLARGLENFGLKLERRALIVYPGELTWQSQEDGVSLSFSLPAGSYATSVLRELAIIEDVSTKHA